MAPPETGPAGRWEGRLEAPPVPRILRVHGYRDPARVRRPILRAAEAAAALAPDVAAPVAVWRRFSIAALEPEALHLSSGVSFSGASFARTLRNCTEVAVFILTLGERLDEEISARMQDEPVEALFLDTAGWLSVERATRDLARHLDQVLGPELRTGVRLGPGYDYRGEEARRSWPLEEQHALFSLFVPGEPPVRLLESCAMTPKMSRSGLFGLLAAGTAATDENAGAFPR
ncbi:hypothetical protein [Lutibaculum baratangense]|uniref:Uncharacterized protein n=1 Tax=Lutibaculum baratangense AMV1 TaxID=631454 RepID=V4RDP7_9HYPH|nr:hypothetical protein [Lutibaculum baratangense]ESR23494.1 hypothetical protein N177_3562 [Lutibaculum baratangense AMV1]